MDPVKQFAKQVKENIEGIKDDRDIHDLSRIWLRDTVKHKYSYNFSWLGRPIIQYPQDVVAMQEIIWMVEPDLIIETGIAHGGSLIFSASMLALLDYCDAVKKNEMLNPRNSKRRVLGIDIDIRKHNRSAIRKHPLFRCIDMIEGSSVAPETVEKVHTFAQSYKRILVCLDSMHTHDHVLSELEVYAPLTSMGSYCVVFDTIIEDMPEGFFHDRPWDKGNNPKTAVHEYLSRLDDEGRTDVHGVGVYFEIDKNVDNKLLISVAPEGFLKRIPRD